MSSSVKTTISPSSHESRARFIALFLPGSFSSRYVIGSLSVKLSVTSAVLSELLLLTTIKSAEIPLRLSLQKLDKVSLSFSARL